MLYHVATECQKRYDFSIGACLGSTNGPLRTTDTTIPIYNLYILTYLSFGSVNYIVLHTHHSLWEYKSSNSVHRTNVSLHLWAGGVSSFVWFLRRFGRIVAGVLSCCFAFSSGPWDPGPCWFLNGWLPLALIAGTSLNILCNLDGFRLIFLCWL